MLTDGDGFERVYETAEGPVLVLALVAVRGEEVILRGLTFYPLTSAEMRIGVGEVLRIFREVSEEARLDGFTLCSLEAFRSRGARPGRMLYLSRRLR